MTTKFAYLNISVYAICTEHPFNQKVQIPLGSLKHFKASLFESSYRSTQGATVHPCEQRSLFHPHEKCLVRPSLAHSALDMDRKVGKSAGSWKELIFFYASDILLCKCLYGRDDECECLSSEILNTCSF